MLHSGCIENINISLDIILFKLTLASHYLFLNENMIVPILYRRTKSKQYATIGAHVGVDVLK